MARLSAEEKIQPHWWTKSLAGAVLGLTLTQEQPRIQTEM